MTAAATGHLTPTFDIDSHPRWLTKRRLIGQLRARDQASARLAELHNLADILNQAADLISTGWLQHSWFAYQDDNGRTKTVTANNVNEMAGRPVVGACLLAQSCRQAAACRTCGVRPSSAPWTSRGTPSSRPRPSRIIGPLLPQFARSTYEISLGGTISPAERRLRQRHSCAAAPPRQCLRPPTSPGA